MSNTISYGGNGYTVYIPALDADILPYKHSVMLDFESVCYEIFGGFIHDDRRVLFSSREDGVESFHSLYRYTVATEDFYDVYELCQTATILFEVDSILLFDHTNGIFETIINHTFAYGKEYQ